MTPEERAEQAWSEAYVSGFMKVVTIAIREAIAAEREACATVAEFHAEAHKDDFVRWRDGDDIATAIRSRSEEGGEG